MQNKYLTVPGLYANGKVEIYNSDEKPDGLYRVLITFINPISRVYNEEIDILGMRDNEGEILSRLFQFNETEYEIIKLLYKGCTNVEIAEQLEISHGTVRNYLTKMMHKMKVDNRTQLIIKVISLGLLEKK